MKCIKLLPLLALCLGFTPSLAHAQGSAPYLFHMTFRGTCYQTNANAQFVSTPITEKDLLLAAAQAGGSSDISTMALVYHVMGSTTYGDTIEILDVNTHQILATLFGLFFGDDASLGRSANTNSTLTEVRREDYIYMFDNTTYTYQNSGGHSMGASFTTKRFLGDAQANVHTTIDGEMQWIVNPLSGAGTKVIKGTFTTTRPFP